MAGLQQDVLPCPTPTMFFRNPAVQTALRFHVSATNPGSHQRFEVWVQLLPTRSHLSPCALAFRCLRLRVERALNDPRVALGHLLLEFRLRPCVATDQKYARRRKPRHRVLLRHCPRPRRISRRENLSLLETIVDQALRPPGRQVWRCPLSSLARSPKHPLRPPQPEYEPVRHLRPRTNLLQLAQVIFDHRHAHHQLKAEHVARHRFPPLNPTLEKRSRDGHTQRSDESVLHFLEGVLRCRVLRDTSGQAYLRSEEPLTKAVGPYRGSVFPFCCCPI